MRKSLFLYLFIIAVLMNVFTYKYFTSKESSEQKATKEATETKVDSLSQAGTITYDADIFSLENNDRAQNYYEKYNTYASVVLYS